MAVCKKIHGYIPLRPPDMIATATHLEGVVGFGQLLQPCGQPTLVLGRERGGEDMDDVLLPFGKQTPPTWSRAGYLLEDMRIE